MTLSGQKHTPPNATRTGPALALCLVLAVTGMIGGLYGMRAGGRNGEVAPDSDCGPANATIKRISPLMKGEVAGLQAPATSKPVVDLSFKNPDGSATKLSDFRGKTILLNLWATWCAPCRQEMPSLDRLQETLGGKDFEVVAINIDTQRLERAKHFLQEVKISKLGYYSDPSAGVFTDLKKAGKAFGMPTTLLIDQKGCELGTLSGPAEWASEDAKTLIRAAMEP